jgi:hypothetical protein
MNEFRRNAKRCPRGLDHDGDADARGELSQHEGSLAPTILLILDDGKLRDDGIGSSDVLDDRCPVGATCLLTRFNPSRPGRHD